MIFTDLFYVSLAHGLHFIAVVLNTVFELMNSFEKIINRVSQSLSDKANWF